MTDESNSGLVTNWLGVLLGQDVQLETFPPALITHKCPQLYGTHY